MSRPCTLEKLCSSAICSLFFLWEDACSGASPTPHPPPPPPLPPTSSPHCHGQIVYQDKFLSVLDRVVDVRKKKKNVLCNSSLFELLSSTFQHCNPAKLSVLTSNSTQTRRQADAASLLPLIMTIFSSSSLNNFFLLKHNYRIALEGFYSLLLKNVREKKIPNCCRRKKVFFIVAILTSWMQFFFLTELIFILRCIGHCLSKAKWFSFSNAPLLGSFQVSTEESMCTIAKGLLNLQVPLHA